MKIYVPPGHQSIRFGSELPQSCWYCSPSGISEYEYLRAGRRAGVFLLVSDCERNTALDDDVSGGGDPENCAAFDLFGEVTAAEKRIKGVLSLTIVLPAALL
ncbi:hypothetical protein ABDI30_12400 [Paenibacillus cisolokensis]|uniref:hypothetical protein n=1 Tax=Paenibacillus cisolokensis TaxID=1658519 RepID=UPI003D2997A1